MNAQEAAETESQKPEKKHSWIPWVLAGGILYLIDQCSKLWIVNHFPLTYVNEKEHIYLFNPSAKGFQHVNADGTLDLGIWGNITDEGISSHSDLPAPTMEALQKLAHLEPISYCDGMINITRVHNTGVAFGMGNGTAWSSYVFLAIPVLALIGLIVLYLKNFFATFWLKVAFVLLLAGIAGNLTDRLIQGFLLPYEQDHSFFVKLLNGYVVDFIDVTIPVINYRWPSFNVADSCIFVAAIIFFIVSIAGNGKKKSHPV